jgi:hypothetical protein
LAELPTISKWQSLKSFRAGTEVKNEEPKTNSENEVK